MRISLSNVLKNYRKSSEQSKRSSCSLSSSIVSLRIVRQKKKKKKESSLVLLLESMAADERAVMSSESSEVEFVYSKELKAALDMFLPQRLVPISLDIDAGGARYVDSLLWPLEEQAMSSSEFAEVTSLDLKLPFEFSELIAHSVREQTSHALALARHLADREHKLPPLVVLRVDVMYNGQRFRDDIRWDTTSTLNAPEAVAKQTCSDLALSAPFDAAIAFAMRRELVRAALGCAAVDPRGTSRVGPTPATVPRQETLINSFRPKSGRPAATAARPTPPAAAPRPPLANNPIPDLKPTPLERASSSTDRAPRAINSYIMFSSRHRGRIAGQNPSLSTVEISRIMGELWRNMPADEREQYEKMARDENIKRQAAQVAPPPPVMPPPVARAPPAPQQQAPPSQTTAPVVPHNNAPPPS